MKSPPIIDMRPDGTFAPPQQDAPTGDPFGQGGTPRGFAYASFARGPLRMPWSTRLVLGSFVLAFAAGTVAIMAFALWLLAMVLPVLVIGAGAAWLALKWRRWSGGRQRGLRPGQPYGFGQ